MKIKKDLNKSAYSIDICYVDMLEIRLNSIRLVPSKSASKEMLKHKIRIRDCRKILEEGYDAPRRRGKDTIEKWHNKGNKTYNIVIVKSTNYSLNEEIYLITHIGKFTRKK